MYCWIEPLCGCSICIGPPRELSPNWSCGGGLRSRQRTFRYGALPHLSWACSPEESKKWKESLVGYLLKPICRRHVHIPAADFSRTSKHSPTLNLRNPSRFSRQDRGALQDSWNNAPCADGSLRDRREAGSDSAPRRTL